MRDTAVIGAGRWGQNHIRILDEMGRLYAVCDSRADKLTAEGFAWADMLMPFSAILKDPEVSNVIIATPACTHFTLAREAMEQGINVLVEKPACLDLDKAMHLCDEARFSQLVLMGGHRLMLHHPVFKLLSELVHNGHVGEIRRIEALRLNSGIVRGDHDVLQSLAPHDIAMSHALLPNQPIFSVMAQPVSLPESGQIGHARLKFHIGNVAFSGRFSWQSKYRLREFCVIGERGHLLFNHRADRITGFIDNRFVAYDVPGEHPEPLRSELEEFFRLCDNGKHVEELDTDIFAVTRILSQATEEMEDHAQLRRA